MLNKVMIIGNLGADPETRYTEAGVAVATFNVATSERYKNKAGEQVENTEWHRIVAWRRLAEVCGEYLAKGSKVYLEGKLQTRKWMDKEGNDKYTTEIVAHIMQMLDGRKDQSEAGDRTEGHPDHSKQEEPSMGADVPF